MFNMYALHSSQISAPSGAPIVTSKQPDFFCQTLVELLAEALKKRKAFLACLMIFLSKSDIVVILLAKSRALSKSSCDIEG